LRQSAALGSVGNAFDDAEIAFRRTAQEGECSLIAGVVMGDTRLAVPAVLAAGGHFLAGGNPAKVYEDGVDQRTVLIEFDSLAQAIAGDGRVQSEPRMPSIRKLG
jgi:hypothetical protein